MLAEYCQAVEDAGVRLDRLNKLIGETSASWSMAPVVAAYQAMRGVAFMTAVTLVVEIGDVRRFDSPRQLMAYLGLVPTESSTGERVRRGGITKAGNARAPGADWGGVDIPLSSTDQPHNQREAGRPAEVGLRDCVERASEAVHSISKTDKCRQGQDSRRDSHRARNGRLHMGDRARSSAP